MTARPVYLSRVDIRQTEDRSSGAILLRYTGRKLQFFERLYGYDEGVFFAVVPSEIPLPEDIVVLAASVGANLDTMQAAKDLRRAVAEVILAEAVVAAPEHLSLCAQPRTLWLDVDQRSLEHRILAAENRLREVTRALEAALRRRAPLHVSSYTPRSYDPMPPAHVLDRPRPQTIVPPPPPEVTEVVEEEAEVVGTPVETSEAAGRRVMAAVKVAREQELPQRLPGGVRKALGRLPAGLYLSHGVQLDFKRDICSAMVDGAECGKHAGEASVIDWDGEWPVVARRYGSHGRIVYRVEDALRRQGLAAGEAA